MVRKSTRGLVYALFGVFLFSLNLQAQNCSTIDFTITKSGCGNQVVTFHDTGTALSNAHSTYWDFGKGKGYEPAGDSTFNVYTPGVYSIFLKIVWSDGSGNFCEIKKNKVLTINSAALIKFGSPSPFSCDTPAYFTLTDSTPGSVNRKWYIDGVLQSDSNKTMISDPITKSGKHTVSIIMSDAAGCTFSLTKTDYLYIPEKIKADFCGRLVESANFKDIDVTLNDATVPASGQKIASWTWLYPGGKDKFGNTSFTSTSTNIPPNPINYKNIDTNSCYPVSLIVKTTDGCIDTMTKQCYVTKYYKATQATLCIKKDTGNFTIRLTKKMSSPKVVSNLAFKETQVTGKILKYTFYDWGDATFRMGMTYDSSSCADTVEIPNIFKILPPKSSFYSLNKAQCTPPDTVHFINDSKFPNTGVTKYTWYFFDTLGLYLWTTKKVGPYPANIIGKIGPYTAASPSARDTSFIFKKFGIYSVALVSSNTNGCKDSVCVVGYVKIADPVPIAWFDPDTICLGTSPILIDSTDPLDDPSNPYKRTWSLTSNDSNSHSETKASKIPKFSPEIPGIYTLKYSVQNGNCALKDTIDSAALVVFGMQANIKTYGTDGCPPFKASAKAVVSYNYPALLANGKTNRIRYKWSIVPATGATINNDTLDSISYTITGKGAYTIKVSLANSYPPDKLSPDSCKLTISKSSVIAVGTQSNFTMDSTGCKNVFFPLNITPPANPKLSPHTYKWKVVSGTASNAVFLNNTDSGKSVKIGFINDGVYGIQLTGTSAKGGTCTSSDTQFITIATPKAAFDTNTVERQCYPQSVDFDASSSKNAVSYFWDFNYGKSPDTLMSTSAKVSHIFNKTNPFGYNVMLVVKNSYGCTDTFIKYNMVKIKGPVATFTMNIHQSCGNGKVTFINTSLFNDKYKIDFRDGSPIDTGSGTGQVITHQYSYKDDTKATLTYNPILIVESNGCLDFYEDQLVLFRPPVPNFGAVDTMGCAPFTAVFKDSTQFGSKYFWDLNGDGVYTDAFVPEPTYKYVNSGKYTVGLTVLSDSGCTNTFKRPNFITVNGEPKAKFGVKNKSVCKGWPVYFLDSSTSSIFPIPTKITRVHWDFGDGSVPNDTSDQFNPSYIYLNPGFHDIKLTVYNDYGCTHDTTLYNAAFSENGVNPPSAELVNATVRHNDYSKGNANDGIDITWNRGPKDLSLYYLDRNDGAGFYNIHKSSILIDTTYYDPNTAVNPNLQAYSYQTHLLNACLDTSPISKSHTTMHMTLSSPPNSNSIVVDWSSYRGWAGIQKYELYRHVDFGTPFKLYKTLAPTDTSYYDSNLCTREYYYYIKAYSATDTNIVSLSNWDSLTPDYVYQTTGVPIIRSSVLDNKYILTDFEKGTQPNIRGYVIDRYTLPNGWKDNYAYVPAGPGPFRFVDTFVKVNEKVYQYRIHVEDLCGNISPAGNVGTNMVLGGSLIKGPINQYDDQRSLLWNRYTDWQTPDLLEQYIVQFYNPNNIPTKRWELSYPLHPGLLDTTHIDDSAYTEMDTATCYRVLALRTRNGIDPDTSISNIFCLNLPARMFVPNTFTPNGDGVNDVFIPVTYSMYHIDSTKDLKYSFKIYDRWGQKVFESHNLKVGWNGSKNNTGDVLEDGMYIYTIEVHGYDGQNIYMPYGRIYLIR